MPIALKRRFLAILARSRAIFERLKLYSEENTPLVAKSLQAKTCQYIQRSGILCADQEILQILVNIKTQGTLIQSDALIAAFNTI
jgi:hypothetical protein